MVAQKPPERFESIPEPEEPKESKGNSGGTATPQNGHVVAASVLGSSIKLIPYNANLLEVYLLTEESAAGVSLLHKEEGDDSE
ncbi:hypothetical protein [Desmospora activa]|uniref:hypothetical protein n=1 Tax=Desmospora activa TaxID=500615 RepID=UPI000D324FA3|nr:hypothetical protein [Desmospora activa]